MGRTKISFFSLLSCTHATLAEEVSGRRAATFKSFATFDKTVLEFLSAILNLELSSQAVKQLTLLSVAMESPGIRTVGRLPRLFSYLAC